MSIRYQHHGKTYISQCDITGKTRNNFCNVVKIGIINIQIIKTTNISHFNSINTTNTTIVNSINVSCINIHITVITNMNIFNIINTVGNTNNNIYNSSKPAPSKSTASETLTQIDTNIFNDINTIGNTNHNINILANPNKKRAGGPRPPFLTSTSTKRCAGRQFVPYNISKKHPAQTLRIIQHPVFSVIFGAFVVCFTRNSACEWPLTHPTHMFHVC